MNSTISEVGQGFAGIAAMCLVFVGPGFLWARLTNVAHFRSRSPSEKFLWSIVLSLPLTIALCALLGRVVSASVLTLLFAGMDLAALLLLLKARWTNAAPQSVEHRSTRWMLLLMALFGAYCILAVTDVQVGHHLYVSTVIADWSVRVAMVEAAIRSAAAGVAVPPTNGLSTVSAAGLGHAPALRYYYFWYVVVAYVARTFHLQAHASLAASCTWAGWSLIAASFLTLKYMLGAHLSARVRYGCFILLLVGGVLGLDIFPTALLWFSPKLHPYPEMEYWHQDRTPSFLGAVLYAPHHMAAFAALLTAFLVLLLTAHSAGKGELIEKEGGRAQALSAAAFAGIAFAAASGTSLFPTFCFVFVLSLWAVDLLRRREFRTMAALAAAGALALMFARPYLHELSEGSSAAGGFANLRWRNDDFVFLQQQRHHLFLHYRGLAGFLARQPMVLVLDFFDFGFYTLVLLHGVRVLRRKGRLSGGECALVALILGAAVPAFLLSSTATSGPNDLGVDAGFLFRFGLQIAAVPWVWRWWGRWRTGELAQFRRSDRYVLALASILFVLGWSGQVYQAISERFYYPVVGSGAIRKQMDAFTQDRLSERLYNIRSAYAGLDARLPPSAPDSEAIQFNPVGVMQPAETIYSNHQVAAWDTGCGTSYGGDYARCEPVYRNLLFLFGNTAAGVLSGRAENDRQDGAAARVATREDFEQTCRTLHLAAVVAESTDPIWHQSKSWVWTAPLLTSNETIRILRCPESAPAVFVHPGSFAASR